MAGKQVEMYGEQLAYGISPDSPTKTIDVGGVSIYPTRITLSKEGEIKPYKGPAGTVISLVVPEQYDQLSVEGYIPESQRGATASIKKGEVCNINIDGISLDEGGTYRLESFSVNWANEDVAQVSCMIRQYPTIDS